LVAGLLFVACADGGVGAPTTPPPQPPVVTTVTTATTVAITNPDTPSSYDQVLDQIRRDGDVTLPTALQAFSLAFGALPGVTVPAGPRESVVYGGGPLRWIERYWAELTDAQRVAAIDDLGFDPTASFADAPVVSGLRRARPAAREATCDAVGWQDPPGVAPYRAMFDAALTSIGQVVGPHSGLVTVRQCQKIQPGDDPQAWATAHMQWGNGYVGCVMYVYPPLDNAPPVEQLAVITHEAWHCFQGSTAGGSSEHLKRPAWVVEGQATWVGEAFGGGPTNNAPINKHWQKWMQSPDASLLGRSYDAVGFWATLAAVTGRDAALGVMLQTVRTTGDNEAFYSAAVAGLNTAVENQWASRYFRRSAPPAWDTVGPGVPSASVAPAPKIDTRAVGSTITASAHSAAMAYLDVTSEVVIIAVNGPTRLGDKSGLDVVVNGTFTGCTRGDRCACPEGTTAPSSITQVDASVRVAVTGVTQETAAQTKEMSLKQWCQQTPTTTSAPTTTEPAELSTCAVFTWGDARLMTPDVKETPANVEMIPGSGTGSCLYYNLPDSKATSNAFILRESTAEFAAAEYELVTGCKQDNVPGVGDRAGTYVRDNVPVGCLLKGRTIVMLDTNGNAAAIPEVLKRIAARL
jgi:hypothetical protein